MLHMLNNESHYIWFLQPGPHSSCQENQAKGVFVCLHLIWRSSCVYQWWANDEPYSSPIVLQVNQEWQETCKQTASASPTTNHEVEELRLHENVVLKGFITLFSVNTDRLRTLNLESATFYSSDQSKHWKQEESRKLQKSNMTMG